MAEDWADEAEEEDAAPGAGGASQTTASTHQSQVDPQAQQSGSRAETAATASADAQSDKKSTYVPPHLRRKQQQQSQQPQRGEAPPPEADHRPSRGRGTVTSRPTPAPPPAANGASASARTSDSRVGAAAATGSGARPGGFPGGRSRRWEDNPFEEGEGDVNAPDGKADGDGDSGGTLDFDAYSDIPVEVSGDNPPPCMESFHEYDLGHEVNDNVRRCKYSKPTPVQKWAIPIALHGRDLMACAQTGSGKTAAFGLPIVSGITRSGERGVSVERTVYPLALVLSPTRELTTQIYNECRKFAFRTGARPVVIYGGAAPKDQLKEINRGVELLIATPGRLMDFLDRGVLGLQRCIYLVLDEADRMLDMGFEPQIREIVEKRDLTPVGQRQTVMFSATFPKEIQQLAGDFLSKGYLFLSVGRVGSSTDLITQRVEFVRSEDKHSVLLDLLQSVTGRTLVFVQTKRTCDWLEMHLRREGFTAMAIHGDRQQSERDSALKAFKKADSPIMVATDVAARGLDIPNVAHVINYDLPGDIDDYTHRIGRTGRAGKRGYATALFSERDVGLAPKLVELMRESNQEVPGWLEQYAKTSGGAKRRSSGGGGSKFGGRDIRHDVQQTTQQQAARRGNSGQAPATRTQRGGPSPWD